MNIKLFEKRILFEDNHIIIINKEASEIVQGDKTGDKPLSEITKEYIKIKYKKPGNVFMGVVHRIDRPVSGAVIFAKTGKALSRLNELIKNNEINKSYWAVVAERPPQMKEKLVHFLRKNAKQNKSYPVRENDRDAKRAELNYELIGTSNDYFLLEIDLVTGRHHQVRAQLATINCRIKGDLKYGAPRSNKDASIHLHARKISFIHPVKKEKIEVVAPVPNDPLWKYFEENLSPLKKPLTNKKKPRKIKK